jgi:hypothetical protein
MKVSTNIVLLGVVGACLVSCRARDERMASLQKALGDTLVQPQKIGDAAVIGDIDLTGNRNVEAGLPKFTASSFIPKSDVYLSRKQFVIYYNVKAKIPAWTAWQVVDTDLGEQLYQPTTTAILVLTAAIRRRLQTDQIHKKTMKPPII